MDLTHYNPTPENQWHLSKMSPLVFDRPIITSAVLLLLAQVQAGALCRAGLVLLLLGLQLLLLLLP
jgi:hypothetical protein